MAVRVSVIIPCFNAAAWIRQTLQSVAAQELDDIEVIVVDDGSTDGSTEAIRQELSSAHLVKTSNRGASHARNLGTSLASGKFLQYLDADDILVAGKIRAQLGALDFTGADVAYGDWQKLLPSAEGWVPGDIVAQAMNDAPELELFKHFWCPPAAYLFRRRIVDQVGGWNEGLRIIQDARFALDCALRGGSFVHTPGLMAYYRVHCSGSVSTSDPIGFARDCLRNAQEVEWYWSQNGGIGDNRRNALLKVYGQIARASFKKDGASFEAAYAALERLQPGYRPEHPVHLAIASRVLGYRRAEALALRYRRVKSLVHG